MAGNKVLSSIPIFNSPGIVNLLYLPFNGKKRLQLAA